VDCHNCWEYSQQGFPQITGSGFSGRIGFPDNNKLGTEEEREDEMNEENLRNAQILLVVHNAVLRGGDNTSIGDIILTGSAFYFLRYCPVMCPGLLPQMTGLVLSDKGWVPGVSSLQKNAILGSRDIASGIRNKLYSFPLAERVTECPKSLEIASNDVDTLHTSAGLSISIKTRSGKYYDFFVPLMDDVSQNLVNSWPEGGSLYDVATDSDGFFLASGSPSALLRRIGNGDGSALTEVCRLGESTRYANLLYDVLQKCGDADRTQYYRSFLGVSETFRGRLIAIAAARRKKALRQIATSKRWLPVLVVTLLLLTFGPLSGLFNYSWYSIVGSVFVLILTLAATYDAFGRSVSRQIQRAQEVEESLQTSNTHDHATGISE